MERGLISRQLERIGGSHFFGGIFPLKSARCRGFCLWLFTVRSGIYRRISNQTVVLFRHTSFLATLDIKPRTSACRDG